MKTTTKRLTKAEQRVVIAKDVLAQLRAKKLWARVGSYCEYDGPSLEKGKRRNCMVCALGALFVAKVDRYNKIDLSVAAPSMGDMGGISETGPMRAYLEQTFPVRQTALIEASFEGNPVGVGGQTLSLDDVSACSAYYVARRDSHGARLASIMRNIVRNAGTFIPAKGIQ